MSPASFVVVTSSADFSHTGFRQQVIDALTATSPASAEGPPSAQVRACVQKLAGRASLIRVENAYYEGQPATLVVIRTSSGGKAWIAGKNCSATSRDVLDTTSVPPGIYGP
jgi:hypothetical protein